MEPTRTALRLRRLSAAIGLAVLAPGCSDGNGLPFSPITDDRVYSLGEGIEVFDWASGGPMERIETWVVADTLFIRADGTGEARTYRERRLNGVVESYHFVNSFRHRPIENGLRVDFIVSCAGFCLSIGPWIERFDLRDGRLYRPLGRGIYPYDRID